MIGLLQIDCVDYSLYRDNILFYKFGKINRFDIVIIEMDHGPHKGEKLVKRVVGLPGETIKYENNTLYINIEERINFSLIIKN